LPFGIAQLIVGRKPSCCASGTGVRRELTVTAETGRRISRRILSGDQGMVVWWSIGTGVHVEPHSHSNEQIVWMLKGKMEFRLGSEQRVCGPGDVVVIP
jgi:quercetin dioxygenase-like cupin family protein